MDFVVIRNSDRQELWLLPFFMGAALVGLGLLHKGLYPWLAWSLVALFPVGVIFLFALNGAREENRLVINDEGILDHTLGIGMIPWSDVLDAQIESKYNNHYICLKLSNSDYYLSKFPPKRRQKMAVSHNLGFTRFNVNVAGAEADILKILDIIKKKSRERRSDEG